jgi:hypothetical protein
MHALCHYTVHLLRQLLPKTSPLRPMPMFADDVRPLLPKAVALRAVSLHTVRSGQLLPKAFSHVLLAGEQAAQLLSAGLQCGNLGNQRVASQTTIAVHWTIEVSLALQTHCRIVS